MSIGTEKINIESLRKSIEEVWREYLAGKYTTLIEKRAKLGKVVAVLDSFMFILPLDSLPEIEYNDIEMTRSYIDTLLKKERVSEWDVNELESQVKKYIKKLTRTYHRIY